MSATRTVHRTKLFHNHLPHLAALGFHRKSRSEKKGAEGGDGRDYELTWHISFHLN
jgi:hypothetical protein